VVKRWVVNASPIISLVKINRIHYLLSELCLEKLMQVGLRISPTILAHAIALAKE
jgi:hypothetical protein